MVRVSERIKCMIEDLFEEIGTLDPFVIIDHVGIDLHYVDFGANPLGQYIILFDTPTILLNKSIESSPQKYFVASHELHHALEHEEIASYYTLNALSRSKMEQEANKFAVYLCYNLYIEENGLKSFTKADLAALYGVPLELLEVLL